MEGNALRFRRMEDTPADYALLSGWLADPEIHAFYEGRPLSIEEVAEKFGPCAREEESVVPLILLENGEPAGYLQYYPADLAEYHAGHFAEAFGCRNPYAADLFLGGSARLGKGLGTAALRMLRDYLFGELGCDLLLIDPAARNTRAIRCYRRCGFIPVAHYSGEEGLQIAMAALPRR